MGAHDLYNYMYYKVILESGFQVLYIFASFLFFGLFVCLKAMLWFTAQIMYLISPFLYFPISSPPSNPALPYPCK